MCRRFVMLTPAQIAAAEARSGEHGVTWTCPDCYARHGGLAPLEVGEPVEVSP